MTTAIPAGLAPADPVLVFVAPGVPEAAIHPARFGGPVEVVRLEAGNGLAQITRALERRRGLAGLHIFGDGASLDLEAAAPGLAAWGAALRPHAAIGLHGCGLGASETGWHLLGRLAALTGADVSASDDVSGWALLGG